MQSVSKTEARFRYLKKLFGGLWMKCRFEETALENMYIYKLTIFKMHRIKYQSTQNLSLEFYVDFVEFKDG